MKYAVLVVALLLAMSPARARDFDGIVDDARLGRIDVCRDPRWAEWRFARDKQGRKDFDVLFALVAGKWQDIDIDPADPYSGLRQRGRISAFQRVLNGLGVARNRAAWRKAFRVADKRVAYWRQREAAIVGTGLAALSARRALWARAKRRIDSNRHARVEKFGLTVANIETCLVEEPLWQALSSFALAVVNILNEGRWPSEARDGAGATMDVLKLDEGAEGAIGVKHALAIGLFDMAQNWARLRHQQREGRMPAGALVLARDLLDKNPEPVATLQALKERVDQEWREIESFLATLPPPTSVGEELFRRTRLSRYGRLRAGEVLNITSVTPALRAEAIRDFEARAAPIRKANIARAKELLQTRSWFDDDRDGEGAEESGWSIVADSDEDVDFQREVLKRLEKNFPAGRVEAASYAYLWDRIAVKEKRPQRYGTKLICSAGEPVPEGGVEDPPKLDERRRKLGLVAWTSIASLALKCR